MESSPPARGLNTEGVIADDQPWRYRLLLCLRWAIGLVALILCVLTYKSISGNAPSRSKFGELLTALSNPDRLAVLISLLLLPLAPFLRRRLSWLLLPCLLGGMYLHWLLWPARTSLDRAFSGSHQLRLNRPSQLSSLILQEESDHLRQCVSPLVILRPYLSGATLILPSGFNFAIDAFHLHSIAYVKEAVREPYDSEVSSEAVQKFASRPGARQYIYRGCMTTEPGYMFIGPDPAKRYRVYSQQRNIVLVEDGYVIK